MEAQSWILFYDKSFFALNYKQTNGAISARNGPVCYTFHLPYVWGRFTYTRVFISKSASAVPVPPYRFLGE